MPPVLVDTSAWIEFLRGTGGAHHRWLAGAVGSEQPLAWTEPILMELMAGASNQQAPLIESLLLRGPLHRVESLATWRQAAELGLYLRARGAVVRSAMDLLIASIAIRDGLAVLARDRDFDQIAEHVALELVAV